MAAGRLPSPGKVVRGTEIGPCVEPCAHTDCAATRATAAALCKWCGKPIGYETGYFEGDDGTEHELCLLEAIEQE